jgi:murein L,D-transpeptidase YcbB/YkuD
MMTPGPSLRAALAALALLALAGCATPGPTASVPALKSLLLARDAANAGETAELVALYEKRNFQPVWTGSEEAESRALVAEGVLARADEQGLDRNDYEVDAPADLTSTAERFDYELALSAAVLRYARDARLGRVRPSDIYKDTGLPPQRFDAGAELDRAIRSNTLALFFAGLPPSHPEYRRLVAAMARYRAIADEGGWPSLRAPVNPDLLRTRLAFEDETLAAKPTASVAELRDAVKRFQAAHGLAADGLVGPNTIAALNVTAGRRAEQIAANMERWRWLPRQFERRYVVVDVPDQSVTFVQDGEEVLSSRAIVGRKTTTTPILRTMVQAVVASPPWNIPGDISARDLLPHLKRNPNYLQTRNMVLVDGPADDPHGRKVDWKKETPTQMSYRRIRELPGPNNALGQIMLDMPNDFDVYLHDTPGKALFKEEDRTISNGCIRVEEIFALASLALTGDAEEGLPRLRNVTGKRETQRLALENPLPVYLLYWTAKAREDGTVEFRRDPYERDLPLLAAMTGSAPLRRLAVGS